MKLFLASFAHKTLDKLHDILPDTPNKLQAAFIPTAADPYDDKEFVLVDRDKLTDMGFLVTDIDIKDKTEQELEKLLQPFDVLMVAGGNTFYLLYHAQKSGFLDVAKRLIAKGTVYVGSSAGSILACPTIGAAELFDPVSVVPNLTDYTGMGLVDFLIIPHFDKPRYQERMRKTVEEWSGKGYHLYPLTDEQAIIIDGKTLTFADTVVD